MTAPETFAAFHAFLEQQRPALVETIAREIIATFGEPFASQTPQYLAPQIDLVVGHYLDALVSDDLQPFMQWTEERMALRISQGATLKEVLHAVAFYRSHLLRASLTAVAQQVEQAQEGTMALLRVSDTVASVVGGAYLRHMEQTYADVRTFRTLAEVTPLGIGVTGLDGKVSYANPSFHTMHGYETPEESVVGMSSVEFVAPHEQHRVREIVDTAMAHGSWQGSVTKRRKDGSTFPAEIAVAPIRSNGEAPHAIGVIVLDTTEQKRLEQERLEWQDQIIATQQAMVRELSTPLIPLSENLIAMPLIGAIDSTRAQQVMETLLEGIAHYQVDVAILDITGVRVVDTQVANALVQAARAVRLLGAQVVVTGIRAETARMLVSLGADLTGIITQSTLREGIAWAMEREMERGGYSATLTTSSARTS